MRLLIAGWHGQVARALMEAAPSAADVKSLAVGRPALDLRDPRSIERVFNDAQPTIVINSAAYTAVDKAEVEPERAVSLNVDGARMLARAAARRGVPMIHLSTHYVYDGSKQTPYVEDDETRPTTVFGRSKLDGERAVMEENARHIILRTSWVFSEFGRNFATRLLDVTPADEPLRIVADQHGNPTYAPHLAAAILAIARQVKAKGSAMPTGIYHAAGEGSATWDELARELIARAPGPALRSIKVEPIASAEYPTRAARPVNSELDCRRLDAVFGVRLPPWQEGANACVARAASK